MKKILKKEKKSNKILGWYKSISDAALENSMDENQIKMSCDGKDMDSDFRFEYTDDCYCCKWGKWWVTECET
jgi:hypothetical protein